MKTSRPLACLFLDENRGDPVEANLTLQRGYARFTEAIQSLVHPQTCRIATQIRPFQLLYRRFHVYLVDVGGYPPYMQAPFMLALGSVVRGRQSRLFLFRTEASYKPFQATNPDLMDCPSCINYAAPGAFEKARAYLTRELQCGRLE